MAPMTRCRSTQPGDIPNELMAKYYGQRTSAGLIVTEGTQVSLQGKGYGRTPGIYTPEQIEGWQKITQNVHQKGGKIFLQLWHVGRISNSQINKLQPVAPSAITARNMYVSNFQEPDDQPLFLPTEMPRRISVPEIQMTIEHFVKGAKNSIKSGFDGVEIHGANGYLIDQFLRSNSNIRNDSYGGSIKKRSRFLIEIADAVANAIGSNKTGIRLSPFIKEAEMNDPEIFDTILYAAGKLNKTGIAYLHIALPDWEKAPPIPSGFHRDLRSKFKKTIIITGNQTPESGEVLLVQGLADLIGFGKNFISNPDYPLRVQNGSSIDPLQNPNGLIAGKEKGYTDYRSFSD